MINESLAKCGSWFIKHNQSGKKTNGNWMNAWCKLGNFLANKRNGLLCIDFEQRSFHLLSLKTDDYDPHNDINRWQMMMINSAKEKKISSKVFESIQKEKAKKDWFLIFGFREKWTSPKMNKKKIQTL